MLSIVFALVCGLLIYICYRISHDMVNVVSVFTVPYMLIIPINNLIMVHRGFYLISNKVICLIGGSLLCVFLGYLFTNVYLAVHKRKSIYRELEIESKFSQYRITGMLKYVLFVETVVLLRFIYILLTRGIYYLGAGAFEGQMLRGPLGHLLLTIYPLVPILFLYWLNHKRKIQYLIATVLCVGLLFTTLVKYHVIGMVVLIYLLVSLEDRKYLRKGLILVSGIAIAAFVLNYFIQFSIRGTAANIIQGYYTNHLWNYLAGSLIHDNLIFMEGVNVGVSTLWKIARAVLSPFFIVSNIIFGTGINPSRAAHRIGYVRVGTNGEVGNVIDTFGWFFPSKGPLPEIAFTFLFFVFIGSLFTALYNYSMRKNKSFHITISAMLTFFCFFSFFGEFFRMLPCWEVLVYSVVVLKLFDRRVKIHLLH